MEKQQIARLKSMFDGIAQQTEDGIEFWYARDLRDILGYSSWDKFTNVIEKAITACDKSNNASADHFHQVGKMVPIGSGAERETLDYMLTRYACYLVAMNGDSHKEEIAFAQSYFALQTRKQELIEDRMSLIARMEAREKLRESEKRLSQNIYERGVDDQGFARIRSKGDKALFGISTAEMKSRLGMSAGRPLADFLPAVTIAQRISRLKSPTTMSSNVICAARLQ
jgi:DNA-damage-inducible protein D